MANGVKWHQHFGIKSRSASSGSRHDLRVVSAGSPGRIFLNFFGVAPRVFSGVLMDRNLVFLEAGIMKLRNLVRKAAPVKLWITLQAILVKTTSVAAMMTITPENSAVPK